ncbi:MAG: helix-turn-helix domain-containing protein [Myxococcota bacterium]
MNENHELPTVKELSLIEAARVLELDRRTVKKLVEQGVLPARLASPPSSQRPRYRIPTEEVLTYRNTYQNLKRPVVPGRKQAARNSSANEFPHIRMPRRG